MAQHNTLGKKGEALACEFLIRKGYKILVKNYRYKKFEVDIIAQVKDTIVAVEVKTRSTSDFGDPQDFVKPTQIKHLVETMDHYILSHELDCEVRFDIIGIITNSLETKIEHLEDAFLHF